MESPQSLRYWFKDMLVILFLLFIVSCQFWPLIFDPARKIADDYDGAFTAWSLTKVWNGFEGEIFHPAKKSMAFSDWPLTSALISLPVYWLTGEPVASLNTALLVGQILLVVMMYFLLHELTGKRWLSLAGTMAYSLSTGRMIFIGSLATFQLAGIPLFWLALVQLTKSPSKSWLLVSFLAFWFQLGNNFLTAYFILFSGVIYWLFVKQLRLNLWTIRFWVIFGGIGSIIAALPIIMPYLNVMKTYNYHRPVTDVIHFSMSPEEILTTYFSPLILIILALGILVSRKFNVWLKISLASLMMALGPVLHWLGKTVKFGFHIPLPYLVFYYLLPGFSGFRTPERWIALALMAATVGGVLGISKLKNKPQLIISLGLIIASIVLTKPISTVSILSKDEYPPVYYWLKNQPVDVVIELPIFRWGSDYFSKNETHRMLYQTLHEKTLVNGYSGFSPPEWEDLVARLQKDFPSPALLNELEAMGVDYLIIHQDEYLRWRGETVKIELQPVYNQDQTEVYQL